MACSIRTEFPAKPRPEIDLRMVDSGLLSPDGKFYVCSYEEHDHLARAIMGMWTTAWELVKQGWLKFTFGHFTRGRDFAFVPSNCPDVSQKQLDAIYDWFLAKGGRELPSWYSQIR